MRESYLWSTLKRGLPEVQWSRIESVTGAGLPDVFGCLNGKDCFIELKMFRGKKLTIRASQLAWHTNRLLHGGIAYFVARREDELWIIKSNVVVNLAKHPQYSRPTGTDGKTIEIEPPRSSATAIFRKPFPWPEVAAILFS